MPGRERDRARTPDREGPTTIDREGSKTVESEELPTVVGDESTVEARLRRKRIRVATLSTDGGAYAVGCRESGIRPAPVTDATFETYAAAEEARDAASSYREVLQSLDPALDEYDLGVCEARGSDLRIVTYRESTGDRRENGLPRSRQTVTVAGERSGEWLRVGNGPVVRFMGRDARLDDEFVSRQLRSTLRS